MPVNDVLPDDESDVKSYAVRRVNPFLGVLQVIETSGGRAISTNGVVWDIEVRAPCGSDWGSLNNKQNLNDIKTAFYRYGLWSLDDGLVSRPLAPHLDNDPLAEQCTLLIHCIKQRLDALPFQLMDSQELWLFDEQGNRPVALLASAIPGVKRPSPEPRYWSSHIGADGVASQFKFPDAAELLLQVKQLAGFNTKKYWIVRQPDGSGVFELTEQQISAEVFPPFLLTEEWGDEQQEELVTSYINWIAPSLLTLQGLSQQQRIRLEQKLSIQAVSIEHHKQLYPEVVSQECIVSAQVQCKLQKANQ